MNKFLIKKNLLIIFVGAVFCNLNLFAAYQSAITTDPLDLINSHRFNIRYEHLLEKNNSITAEFLFDNNYSDVESSGFLLGASYRWYLRDVFPIKTTALEGFAVGPFARLGFYNQKITVNSDNDFALEIGGEVIYKWVFGGFAVEPIIRIGFKALGPGYYSKGFYAWPGVSIGYAWSK